MREERSNASRDASASQSGWRRQCPQLLDDRQGVSTREAAATLGRSERSVQRAIANGEIAATRIGAAYRISREELARASSRSPTPPSGPVPPTIVALPVLAERMASLPEPISSFIGRGADVAIVLALLDDPTVRLLTLTGPGGIGKTRLSLAAAHLLDESRFPDGVVFVGLADVQSPEMVIPAIAQALGLRTQSGRDPAEHLGTFMRPKHLLLVLDNFEHLLAAGPEVSRLLAGAPASRMLITSRAPLRVVGERELAVQPLGVAAAGATTETVIASDAVQLFIARAQGHDTSFAMDERAAPLVSAICARLDGLPLAIELAAARAKILPLPQLLDLLDRRLPLLTRGRHDAPSRHRTMRDAIAWSYDLLSASEQSLFRRLAIFEGSFTLDAVAWMTGGATPSSLDHLDMAANLVDHNLVVSEVRPDRESRFRLLETIREFGLEQAAAAGEEAEARALHAAYFLHLARDLRPWASTHARLEPMDQLAAEHANLSQALQWLDLHGPAADFTELVAALGEYWMTLGLFREGTHWLERALVSQEEATPPDQARVLIGYGAMVTCQGRFPEAAAVLTDVLSLSEAVCDPLDRARALIFLAGSLYGLGKHRDAEVRLREAYTLAERIEEPFLRAAVAGRVLANLSTWARVQGDFARAMEYSQEAFRLYEGKQLDLAESISRLDSGAAAFAAGDYRLAVELWREGVMLAGELGDLRQIADAVSGLGNVAVARDDARTALLLFGAAEALRERTGLTMLWPPDIEAATRSLASLRTTLGEQAVAEGLQEGRTLSLSAAVALVENLIGPSEDPSAALAARHGLTRRERDVLRQMVQYKTDQEIADALFLSLRTVNWHVRSILGKLDAPSRRAAIVKARAEGLVGLPDDRLQ